MITEGPPLTTQSRLIIIERASWLGIAGNLLLAALKVPVGLISGSLAVAGDGIDSLSDVVTSIVTLYAARAAAVPPDREHPWGHARLETIAGKTLSFIIVTAGGQLMIITITRLFGGLPSPLPTPLALYAALLSIVGKALMAALKFRAARITESPMMQADAVNMRSDILLSLTVLIGILGTRIFALPLIDLIAGFGVSLWIIIIGIRLFLRTNSELMDSVENPAVYREVFAAVDTVPGVSNPHRVRIRRLNAFYVIDLDVEVDGTISVHQAHELACRLEKEIRGRIPKVFDIMVHVEPAGAARHQEGYGLIPADMDAL